MEFGVPFAWAVLKLDEPLQVFRKEDEKTLSAGEIINKRMNEDFNTKFQELVFTEGIKRHLQDILKRVSINYSLAVASVLKMVKEEYQISDIAWQKHLGVFANLTDNTTSSTSGFSAESFNANLATKISIATAIATSTKLAVNLAGKAGSKIATKAGGTIAAKAGAQLLDPLLAVGFLVWDFWDYNQMVSRSRCQMKDDILDHLTEFKFSVLSAPENSIMAAIDEVQSQIETQLASHSLVQAAI